MKIRNFKTFLLLAFVVFTSIVPWAFGVTGLHEKALAAQVTVKPREERPKASMQIPSAPKGIYMTADTFNSKYGRNLIVGLKESGGNAVVVDVQHGGGMLAFTPINEDLKKINPGSGRIKDFPARIEELHKDGIYAIARQVVFNVPYVGGKKPEWRIKNKWGGFYPEKWLDPSLPEVQAYNLLILRELAEMGFDEVQFDYVRFPAANHRNYDYYFDETKQTQADIIVEYLQKARAVADEYGIAIGADVFGVIVWGDVDWRIVGQDPARIAQIVDAIYPMTYPSHFGNGFNGHPNTHNAPYGIVFDSIKKFVANSNGNAQIRPWIQGFPLKVYNFGSWFMKEQVQASFDAGAKGFMIWSPGNKYTYSWPSFSIEPKKVEPTPIEPKAAGN